MSVRSGHPRLPALALALAAFACACGQHDVFALRARVADDAGPARDAAEPVPTWGQWVQTLAGLPDCPAGSTLLLVDSQGDELDGGESLASLDQAGPRLSLREALTIAYNDPATHHTVRFDSRVFPVDEARRILLGPGIPGTLPGSDGQCARVCIDGRDSGAELEFLNVAQYWYWRFGEESVMVGLDLRGTPQLTGLEQIAGCWLQGVGYQASAGQGTRIGPHNVFARGQGVYLPSTAPAGALILDNDFGHDPRTGQPLAEQRLGVQAFNGATLSGNLFHDIGMVFIENIETGQRLVLQHNFLNVDRAGRPFSGAAPLTTLGLGGPVTLGPGNVIHDTWLRVPKESHFEFTQNRVSALLFTYIGDGEDPVSPPEITSASPTRVEGTCPAAGTVELYADEPEGFMAYRASTPCDAQQPWQLGLDLGAGQQVMANLTDAARRTSVFSNPVAVR